MGKSKDANSELSINLNLSPKDSESKLIFSIKNNPDKKDNLQNAIKLSQINFFYGENGSGKSTISNRIKEQVESSPEYEDYEIKLFSGFDSVVAPNDQLNAIAIGEKNAKSMREIIEIDKKIEQENGNLEQLTRDKTEAKEKLDKARKSFTDACKDTADKLLNSEALQGCFTGTTVRKFNQTAFKKSIEKKLVLSDSELDMYIEQAKGEEKRAEPITFPKFNTAELKKQVTALANNPIEPSEIPIELKDNQAKQRFAKDGFNIHKHQDGSHDLNCAFCGQRITESRWELLKKFFNDEVSRTDKNCTELIDKITNYKNDTEKIPELDEEQFYSELRDQVRSLNKGIRETKEQCKNLFVALLAVLDDKKTHIFSIVPTKSITNMDDTNFEELQKKQKSIIDNNQSLCSQIKPSSARDAVWDHYAYKEYRENEFHYDVQKKQNIYDESRETFNRITADCSTVGDTIEELKNQKSALIQGMSSENELARFINGSLQYSDCGFSLQISEQKKNYDLEDTNDNELKQKILQIKDDDGSIRDIKNVSTGELNFIAFLYFLGTLQRVTENQKKRIIIFDDPMSSNDAAYQYLISADCRNLYNQFSSSPNDIFILLTHNVSFYMNVRPYPVRKAYSGKFSSWLITKRHPALHASKDDPDGHSRTRYILRLDSTSDIKNSYQQLWDDLRFAYESNRVNLMINTARRIIDTYCSFEQLDKDEIYKKFDAYIRETDRRILPHKMDTVLKLLLNSNSHELYSDDLSSGLDKETFLNLFKSYFDYCENHLNQQGNNNGEKESNHFLRNWKKG